MKALLDLFKQVTQEEEFDAIRIGLASPEKIRSWSWVLLDDLTSVVRAGPLDEALERIRTTGVPEVMGLRSAKGGHAVVLYGYEAGHLLFDRGQPAQHFFVVLEGQVNLVLYSKSGEEKIVDIIGPGNSFAEAVMFMEAPGYPVSAVAATHSTVARFPSREYMSILRESPETCLRMLGHLSQRLHMRIREIEYLTLESATHRLVRHLEGRLEPGVTGPAEITLQESRQELASRLSMKPETLSRILRHLSDAGVIVVQGRVLQVPDRRTLLAVLDSSR